MACCLSVLVANFIDDRMREIWEDGTETRGREVECGLEITDEDVELGCNRLIILYHLALLFGSRLEVELVPCELIPYLILEKSGCESAHLAVSEDPRSIELVGREDGRICGDKYIKILHNIKLFLADGVPALEGVYMSGIEVSLDREEDDIDHGREPPRELAPDVDDRIRCHEDRKYIEEDEHAIVEEESADWPHKSEEESDKDAIVLALIEFAIDGRDEDQEVWEYEDEEFPWREECPGWGRPTECGGEWGYHAREDLELSRIERKRDERTESDMRNGPPRDSFIFDDIDEEKEYEQDSKVQCWWSMHGEKPCDRDDEKRGLLVQEREGGDDEDDTHDIPPVIPPEFLVLDDGYEEYAGRDKSKWSIPRLLSEGIEREGREDREESEEWSDYLIRSVSDEGEKDSEEREERLMIWEGWIWFAREVRKCIYSWLYRIAKEPGIISIGYFVYGISPDTVYPESECNEEKKDEEFFGYCTHIDWVELYGILLIWQTN